MIRYVRGDIFESKSEAIVNAVNCVGVMGRGIALQFKNKYPENYKSYKRACLSGEVIPGKVFVFEKSSLFKRFYIINFPTKNHWKDRSRIEDIESGLVDLVRIVEEKSIRSVAIPKLGCGLGGLEWHDVKCVFERVLPSDSETDFEVYDDYR